jgi:hypothetical protein
MELKLKNMIDTKLNLEANKYAEKMLNSEFHPSYSGAFKENVAKGSYEDFIKGATSNWVKTQKIEAMIFENESILEMIRIHDGSDRLMMPIRERIKTLQELLKDVIYDES